MTLDDLDKPIPSQGLPRNLENMSIEELEAYVTELQAEITRCKDDIAKKQAQKSAADSVFKS